MAKRPISHKGEVGSTEAAIPLSAEQWHAALDAIEDAIAVMDCEQRITLCNSAMVALLAKPLDLIVGIHCYDIVHRTSKHTDECALIRARRTRRKEVEHVSIGGRWFQVIVKPLMDEAAGVVGYVHVMTDISGQMRAEDRTQRRLQQVTMLHNTYVAVTASLDWSVTINVLLDQVMSQLRVDAAAFLIWNPHTQTLDYAGGRGFQSTAIAGSSLRLGQGHAGRAASESRPVHVPDLMAIGDTFVRADRIAEEEFVAYYVVPLIARGQVKGVLEVFHRAPLDIDNEWKDSFDALAGQSAIAIDNAALFQELHRSNIELAVSYDATLEGWVSALDLRHMDTEGHSRRIAETAVHLAKVFGLSDPELVHLRRGALLHDIGKMGIPDGTLLKPGPLAEEDWAVMHRHPAYACQFLSRIPFLRPAVDIPYCHHEKWDGSGYPRGLKGEDIPLSARIFAVVDVWDSLRSDRVYRAAWPEQQVREHIRALSGSHFDPGVVEAFLRMLDESPDGLQDTERARPKLPGL